MFANVSPAIKQYLIVTGNYWVFTLTDGALRMLVVLYFHQLGYSPLAIAMLFLFYEFFGVVTNLVGGWLGARIGLNRTMNIGLGLQIIALGLLLVPVTWLTVSWVMSAQALSGIAKDLNKMSAKSAIKQLVPDKETAKLYKWVALLTGSKNTLKGVGFFLGGFLLAAFGFSTALLCLIAALTIAWLVGLCLLKKDFGRTKNKPKFGHIFSADSRVNFLAAARLFLFAARDVWFVVALPVFLADQLGWQHAAVGSFFAAWTIGYGVIQARTPNLFPASYASSSSKVSLLALPLVALALLLAWLTQLQWQLAILLPLGILVFGVFFALNSSVHSYLIVHFSRTEGSSLDVGFYYTANALGRLLGTMLSGWVYQTWGLVSCMLISAIMIACAALLTLQIPSNINRRPLV